MRPEDLESPCKQVDFGWTAELPERAEEQREVRSVLVAAAVRDRPGVEVRGGLVVVTARRVVRQAQHPEQEGADQRDRQPDGEPVAPPAGEQRGIERKRAPGTRPGAHPQPAARAAAAAASATCSTSASVSSGYMGSETTVRASSSAPGSGARSPSAR